jgi:diketogulonate reductase-like aldo/keto reductase
MGAMEALVNTGKVRFIGVSNFSVAELERAQKSLSKQRIVSNQVRYNLIDRTIEQHVLPYCRANHVTVIAYSPLSRDFRRIVDCDPEGVIGRLAVTIGKTPAQIVLNWCIDKAGVVAIPKANSVERLLENCAASDWRLSEDQLQLLEQKIKYRHRGQFDTLVRRYVPSKLSKLALRATRHLPRGLRRRLT